MNAYLKFWDLERPLFTRVEPVTGLYLPARLTAPLERLLLACEQESAFALITGESGTGKSAMARWLCESLPSAIYDSLLMTMVRREQAPGWLIPRMAEHLGVGIPSGREFAADSVRAIAARLDDYVEQGRKLLVVIDSAHLIRGDTAFDELIAFLGLQALSASCLAFVLVGGEGLPLNLASIAELATRVAYELRLTRLSPEEATAYIEHRVRAASARIIFEKDALDTLYGSTRGIIAALNIRAEGCLIEAYQRSARRISQEIVLAAGASPESAPPPPPQSLLPPSTENGKASPSRIESLPTTRPVQESTEVIRDGVPGISLNSLFKL